MTLSISNILGGSGLTLIIALTLIQITPIKINPWSAIARHLGNALNVDVMDKIDESNAMQSRYRIIRFDDEIRHDAKHTEEHFDQILDDIDIYERYCNEHPKFSNNKAVHAIKNIERVYESCRLNNTFI